MKCPYCQQYFAPTEKNLDRGSLFFQTKDETGNAKYLSVLHVVCPNDKCKKSIIKLAVEYCEKDPDSYINVSRQHLLTKQILPEGISHSYPSYIPKQLREDYEEACKIVDLSPKASATLSRRCLQGIIRDYHGITKGRLVDEVNALQGKIEPDVWNAIDAVRKIGNIGAHMEKDVNVIVEIEPEEAQQLIRLIEMLFDEWYVRREERKKQLQAIQAIAADKDAQKKGSSSVKASASRSTVLTP